MNSRQRITVSKLIGQHVFKSIQTITMKMLKSTQYESPNSIITITQGRNCSGLAILEIHSDTNLSSTCYKVSRGFTRRHFHFNGPKAGKGLRN